MTLVQQLTRLAEAVRVLESANIRVTEARATRYALPCVHIEGKAPVDFLPENFQLEAMADLSGRHVNAESTLGVTLSWFEPRVAKPVHA